MSKYRLYFKNGGLEFLHGVPVKLPEATIADIKALIHKARMNEVGLIDMGDVEYPRKRLEALRESNND